MLAWHSRVTGGGQHFTSSNLRLSLFSGRQSGHHIKIHLECSLFTLYFPSSIFYCACSAPLRVSAKPSIVHHREATLDRKCGLCLDVRAAVQHCSMMRKADRGDSWSKPNAPIAWLFSRNATSDPFFETPTVVRLMSAMAFLMVSCIASCSPALNTLARIRPIKHI